MKIADAIVVGALSVIAGVIGCRRGSNITDLPASARSELQAPPDSSKVHGHAHNRGTRYIADCNDPDSPNPACIHPNEAFLANLRAYGYPYYIGHAEPAVQFFSNHPNSAANMRWKLQLPSTDPSPTQNGSSIANFELFIATWIGLVLCDPTSKPYGACTPVSDSNNPATAGGAFMELQFYPPGGPAGSCSDTKWCAAIWIWSAHDNSAFVANKCGEPGTSAYVTTNGVPTGPPALFSTGDSLTVTIRDTTQGLRVDINDASNGAQGVMVASAATGFRHNTTRTANGVCSTSTGVQCTVDTDCPAGETCGCEFEPFTFHPMYSSATTDHVLNWAWGPNVAFSYEIGHWDLCGDTACTMKPPGADPATCGVIRGVGGCVSSDTDHSGQSYQAKWPDGNAAHPTSFVIGSPNDFGIGPLSQSSDNTNNYAIGYNKLKISTTEGTSGAFYPFYSTAGVGTACRLNFGNDIPGVTTNDFAKTAQYGTSIDNPCYPGPSPALVAAATSAMQ